MIIIDYIKKKSKFVFSLSSFIIIIDSILIEKKHSHKYKVVAISYANYKYFKQLKVNKFSAINVGKVDKYYSYKPEDIDINFKKKNKDILSRRRGNGYWIWKPYFILMTLKNKLDKGDYLISKNEDIWAIRTNYIERKFSKRDAFILLDADSLIYADTYQYMAGIQIYKKTKFSINFVEKLLKYSTDKRIITDDPNTQGLPNYKGFIDNRHDQTILSLLTKKLRFSHLNKNKAKAYDLNKIDVNLMPYIFCIYRRLKFKSYFELRRKCKEIKKYKYVF